MACSWELTGDCLRPIRVCTRVRSHRIGASGALDTQTLPTTSDPPNDLCQLSNGNIYMTCQNGQIQPIREYIFIRTAQ